MLCLYAAAKLDNENGKLQPMNLPIETYWATHKLVLALYFIILYKESIIFFKGIIKLFF